jgi:hypothetical protein
MRCFSYPVQLNFLEQNKDVKKVFTSTVSFYILYQTFQKIAGLMPIHSGCNPALKVGYGVLSFGLCSILSYSASEVQFSKYSLQPSKWFKFLKKDEIVRDLIRKSLLGFTLFSLIEQKNFYTSIPSSILSEGVFANRHGSIIATSNIATESQRSAIQIFGRKYGCHHCGSKQLFSSTIGFIADHQPPTKLLLHRAGEKNILAHLMGKRVRLLFHP